MYTERRHTWTTTYSSHHFIWHLKKLSVPSSLFHRCETFKTDENRKVNREKIKKDLRVCGYPEWAIRQEKQQGEQRLERDKERERDEKRVFNHKGEVCGHALWLFDKVVLAL